MNVQSLYDTEQFDVDGGILSARVRDRKSDAPPRLLEVGEAASPEQENMPLPLARIRSLAAELAFY